MKLARYGLIAFFCLGAVWSAAHFATLRAPGGASAGEFAVVPAAREHAQRGWRYLPILR